MSFSGAKLALFLGADLLVIRRDEKPDIPYPGYWDLPGGGREGDETPMDCALRETREEVGLVLSPDQVSWSVCYERPRGTVWFFAAHVPVSWEADISFGSEGQGWKLMRPEVYCKHHLSVPHFAERLAQYMADASYPIS